MEAALGQVGPRLRAARHAQGLTLEGLAGRAGMSVSTLSRLESGKRQASLELLLPLTRQLGLRLDDLIPVSPVDPRVRRVVEQRDGIVVAPLTLEHSPVQTFKVTFPPVATAPEVRAHDGYEWIYVLSGRVRLLLDDRTHIVRRGEALEFDTRTPHSLSATEDGPAEVLSIFSVSGQRIHTHGEPDSGSQQDVPNRPGGSSEPGSGDFGSGAVEGAAR